MKKQRIAIIIALVALMAAGVYLNRAYAYIFSKFELTAPPPVRDYRTVNTMTEKSNLIRYAAIGDSLTAGVGASGASTTFPALLAEKIAAQKGMMAEVKNLGVPGATSFDILTGQVLDATQYQPDIITLFIGINDMHNFVPIEKFRINLAAAIEALQKTTKAKIYLINLPYLGAKDLILPPYDAYFTLKTQEYNEVIAAVAAEKNLKLIDIYDISSKAFSDDQSMYCLDRFHPSDKGYEYWVNKIYVQLN